MREERGRIDDVLIAWRRLQLRPYLTNFFAQNAADRQVLLKNYEEWIASIEGAGEAAGKEELSRLAKDPTLFPPPHDVDPFRSIALAQTPTYIHEDPSDGLDWSVPRLSSSRPASPFSRYEASAAARDFRDLAGTFAVMPIESDDEDAADALRDAGTAPGSKELDLALIDDLRKYEITLDGVEALDYGGFDHGAFSDACDADAHNGLKFRRLSCYEIREAGLRERQAREEFEVRAGTST
ncbi:hypothetical protein JCM10450v2_001638 [Rhodotorula kratochvilovae]